MNMTFPGLQSYGILMTKARRSKLNPMVDNACYLNSISTWYLLMIHLLFCICSSEQEWTVRFLLLCHLSSSVELLEPINGIHTVFAGWLILMIFKYLMTLPLVSGDGVADFVRLCIEFLSFVGFPTYMWRQKLIKITHIEHNLENKIGYMLFVTK